MLAMLRPLFVLLLITTLAAPPVHAMESFAPVVEKALPAVVNISTTQKIPAMTFRGLPGLPGAEDERQRELERFLKRFGFPFHQFERPEREVNSLGSGFVIDPAGYIVTNNHVIAEASEIVVTFADESKLEAEVVGRDPKTDLALLKVTPKKPLEYVTFGNSDALRVGDWVLAIGNPFGLGSTVTAGIISARSRNINAGPFDDFLQTDAAINRGNSGGPMFNRRGEVIGVNTAIFSPSGGSVGIGFAIPSAMAKPILDQLREHGRAYRGWLGVKIQIVTEEVAESIGLDKPIGALVLELTPESPAQKAGIEPGDVIIGFNGEEVTTMRELPRMVAETPVGETVEVEVWRGDRRKTIRLSLGEFPEDEELAERHGNGKAPESRQGEPALGMYVKTLDDGLKKRLELDASVTGVVVTEVTDESEAARRALRPGDVIVGVNQARIASVEALQQAIEEARNAKRGYVLMRVIRNGASNYITLPIKEKAE